MSTIVTRAGKGSPLTNTEVDSNFTNLNTDKYQSGDNVSFGEGSFSGDVFFEAAGENLYIHTDSATRDTLVWYEGVAGTTTGSTTSWTLQHTSTDQLVFYRAGTLSANVLTLGPSGNVAATYDLYAGGFYDFNNTQFYVKPSQATSGVLNGTLVFNRSDEVILKCKDSGGDYTIYHTINDGQGNYNIMLGMDGAGLKPVSTDGIAKILFEGHGANGTLSLNTAKTNETAFSAGLSVCSTDGSIRVGKPNNTVGLSGTDGTKIANVDGDLFAQDFTAAGTATFTSTATFTGATYISAAQPELNLYDENVGGNGNNQTNFNYKFSSINFRTADTGYLGGGDIGASITARHLRPGSGHAAPDHALEFYTSGPTDSYTLQPRFRIIDKDVYVVSGNLRLGGFNASDEDVSVLSIDSSNIHYGTFVDDDNSYSYIFNNNASNFSSPTSGDTPVVQIVRGSGSHKGSGLHITGANWTNGSNANAAMVQLNAGSYSGANTCYIRCYDNDGADFKVTGDGNMTLSGNATLGGVYTTYLSVQNVGGRSTFKIGDFTEGNTYSYAFQPGPRISSFEPYSGGVDGESDLPLAWAGSTYMGSVTTQISPTQAHTFSINNKDGTRWFLKVKTNDAEAGNDARVSINKGTNFYLDFRHADPIEGEDEADAWHVFDITDEVVTGTNTCEFWLVNGAKVYILAAYVFPSTGIALPNEPTETYSYHHQGVKIYDGSKTYLTLNELSVDNYKFKRGGSDNNLAIYSKGSGATGISGYDTGGNWKYQLYGTGTYYGFLDGNWAGWDIMKQVDGDLTLNNNTSYYLNPASTTRLNTLYLGGSGSLIMTGDSNTLVLEHPTQGSWLWFKGGNAPAEWQTGTNSSGWSVYNIDNSRYDLTINSSGNATFYGTVTASSDIRLKSDIEGITGAVDKVKAIRGVTFKKNGDDKRHVGVIAQEVEAVLPEAVLTAQDDIGSKSVAYGNMVGLLIEAIKEQQAQIESLTAEIQTLKEK
jgi:hypothetical protein